MQYLPFAAQMQQTKATILVAFLQESTCPEAATLSSILHVVLNALSATKSWLHFVSLKTFVDFYFLLEECSSL